MFSEGSQILGQRDRRERNIEKKSLLPRRKIGGLSYYFSDNFGDSEHGFIDTLIGDWETLHLVIAIHSISENTR